MLILDPQNVITDGFNEEKEAKAEIKLSGAAFTVVLASLNSELIFSIAEKYNLI